MEWNDTVAAAAINWANQCNYTHSPKDLRPNMGEVSPCVANISGALQMLPKVLISLLFSQNGSSLPATC